MPLKRQLELTLELQVVPAPQTTQMAEGRTLLYPFPAVDPGHLALGAAELHLVSSRAQQGPAHRGGAAPSGQTSCPIYL